eukprot:GGOE01014288.1.p1 GENE.GGOE01014288.1~~GGOE01014288.1.p1  ORF type:complete len:423 (-),score=106.21 GGOE01014288.1:130-1398(-)
METTFVAWEAQRGGSPMAVVLPKRYEVLEWLGTGSGGTVWKAKDHQRSGQVVAIKSVARHLAEASGALQILREIKVMRHLSSCNSVVTLLDAFRCGPLGSERRSIMCIVMEAMDIDLEAVINTGQVDEDNVAVFTYQLLLGLKVIHQSGIIHRDLKPTNLLVNADCTLKIADFGLARDESGAETMYVVTRLYRAPELLLGVTYDNKVDMFSAGCILGEMLKSMVLRSHPNDKSATVTWLGRDGQPAPFRLRPSVLFPAGNYGEQMRMILALVGFPKDEDIRSLPSDAAQSFMHQLKSSVTPGPPTFHTLFPGIPMEELELLGSLLQFSPQRRYSAEEALHHRWLSEYSDLFPDNSDVRPFDASYEDVSDLSAILEVLDGELQAYVAAPTSGLESRVVSTPESGDWVMLSPGSSPSDRMLTNS